MLQLSRQTKFGSTYVGLLSTKKKKNSDQTILQLSWQNKIRTNLCCNFPHKTKFGLTYVAIVKTNKIRINLCWTFFYKKKIIRIKLYCNCSDKTKFGSTYVAIFHTKQNSDQPMLQFFTQNKIRETCPRMWGAVSAETRKYISNHFRQPRQNSLL